MSDLSATATADNEGKFGGSHRDLVFGPEWQDWTDPDVPEMFNPTTLLLDKHADTATASKTALAVDDADYSYTDLLARVCRAANGLSSLGLDAEARILMFGTDSLDYIATWLGSVRAGIVPAVVSDLYKAENLLYFIRDTAARALYIDAAQLEKLAAVTDELPATLRHVIVYGDAPDMAETYGAARAVSCTALYDGADAAFG